jgi:hypothetical protein
MAIFMYIICSQLNCCSTKIRIESLKCWKIKIMIEIESILVLKFLWKQNAVAHSYCVLGMKHTSAVGMSHLLGARGHE